MDSSLASGPEPPVVEHGVLPRPTLRARFRRLLFAGLLILAPAYLTIYVLVLLFRFMDGIFAPLIDRALGYFVPGIHVPGLGIVLTLCVILFLGWLSRNLAGRRLIATLESVIRRIPVAKTIYGATKGVLEAVGRDQADAFKRVVLVEHPRRGLYALGFVTSAETFWPRPEGGSRTLVPVFLPTSPNPTSGFLLLAPPEDLMECPLTVEEGMRMIVSGGILKPDVVARLATRPPEGDAEAARVAAGPAVAVED